MTGPWTFVTLVGLLVLVQLCNSQNSYSDSPRVRTPRSLLQQKHKISNEENPVPILLRILGNLRRINDIFTFKILDEEARRINLESQITKSNPQRKCLLQKALFGLPCPDEKDIKRPEGSLKLKGHLDEGTNNRQTSLSQKKRKNNKRTDLNSNGDSSVKKDLEKNNKDYSSQKLLKKPLKKHGVPEKSPQANSYDTNNNSNTNINLNYNDETLDDKALNDFDGLDALSDDDNGPGDLNDETDGFNDEVDGLNDEVDGPSLSDDINSLNDDVDGFGALKDDDGGPGALDDED